VSAASGRLTLSVCVIACNEERNIGRCLASASFADECVVVVDARSADGTDRIAREHGAKVTRHAYAGNVEQKNFALDQVSGDWVLALDADEALTAGLAAEILQRLAEEPVASGFELNRVTHHLGRWIRHGEFYPDWQLRLFRRGAGCWAGVNPHGRLSLDGPSQRLDGELEHWSYRDLADQVDRIQDFSSIQAGANRERGGRVSLAQLLLRPPARFLRAYFLKQGFRDGVPGLVIAVATAFHVFLKYAKQWELEHVAPDTPAQRAQGKAAGADAGRAEDGGRPAASEGR